MWSLAILTAIIAMLVTFAIMTQFEASASVRRSVLRHLEVALRIWGKARMRYKVKIVIGLYQCVAAIPSVFNVEVPPGYSQWVSFLEADVGLEIVIPPACIGPYRRQILIRSCWPIIFLAIAACCCMGRELVVECFKDPRFVAPRGTRIAVLTGLQRTLPLSLVTTFVLVPSAATRIFKAFRCDRIEFDDTVTRRYLHNDLALSCESEEYNTTRSLAVAMLVVWPVGVPVMYALLLWLSRKELLSGVRTPLSRATAFLSEDYRMRSFWWEPLEMCRKITLTGWVLLIDEGAEQARVLVALLSSITFLAIHLSIKPFLRYADARVAREQITDSRFECHHKFSCMPYAASRCCSGTRIAF